MNTKNIVAILSFVILFITACGEESNTASGINETDIDGIWLNSCQELSTPSFTGSSIWTITFSADSFIANLDVYETLNCAGSRGASKTMSGVITVSGSFTTEDSGTLVNRIDIEITGTQETPNTIGFDSREVKYNFGNTYYDIFYKEGDIIYFGDTTTGNLSSNEQRPSEIDFNNVYELQ